MLFLYMPLKIETEYLNNYLIAIIMNIAPGYIHTYSVTVNTSPIKITGLAAVPFAILSIILKK